MAIWSECADLLEGDPLVVADDDVIAQVDADELARLVEPLCHTLVLDTGRGIAAGVVVGDNQRGGGDDPGLTGLTRGTLMR